MYSDTSSQETQETQETQEIVGSTMQVEMNLEDVKNVKQQNQSLLEDLFQTSKEKSPMNF